MSVQASPDDDNPHIKAIRSALNTEGLPFASGIKEVKHHNLILYYDAYIGGPVMHCRIDFGRPVSDAELRQLAGSVCPGAEGDVEDHPPLSFSTTFDPHSTGIVDSIRDRALEGQTAGTELRVELGLLSVYGLEVKSYRVAPSYYDSFASLVVVLPTNYEGGALRFRHGGKEYPFDTAESTTPVPHALDAVDPTAPPEPGVFEVAYLAYFSDTDHDIDIVQSGWRVTLTYYLSLKPKPSPRIPENTLSHTLIQPLVQAMDKMFHDPSFLGDGGVIGFGLRHRYHSEDLVKGRLSGENLKGSDTVLWTGSRNLAHDCRICVVYKDKISRLKTTNKAGRPLRHPVLKDKDVLVLCDDIVPPARMQGSTNLWRHLITSEKGKLLTKVTGYKRDVKVHWVVNIVPKTGQRVSYLNPNQESLGYVDRYFVLIVNLPARAPPGTVCLDAGDEDKGKGTDSDSDEEESDEEEDEEEGEEGGGEIEQDERAE